MARISETDSETDSDGVLWAKMVACQFKEKTGEQRNFLAISYHGKRSKSNPETLSLEEDKKNPDEKSRSVFFEMAEEAQRHKDQVVGETPMPVIISADFNVDLAPKEHWEDSNGIRRTSPGDWKPWFILDKHWVLPHPDNRLDNEKILKLKKRQKPRPKKDANPYVNSGRRAHVRAIDYIAMLKTTQADLVRNLKILKILPLPSRDGTLVSEDPDFETPAKNIFEGDKDACERLLNGYLTYPEEEWSHDPFQFELDLSSAPAGQTGWEISNDQTLTSAESG